MKIRQIATLSAVLLTAIGAQGAFADPFKLGVQDSTTLPSQGSYGYPAPQMVQPMQTGVRQQSFQGGAQQQSFQAGAQQNSAPPRPRPPLRAAARIELPKGYLGVWHVRGQRTNVEALPEFQAAAQKFMNVTTDDIWQITGSPETGYTLGNGPMRSPLIVDRIGPDGTAFVKYQHPVFNVMAQEAIVLSLAPNGMQFTGLERVNIIKEDPAHPRAKVTYQLMGQRQR